MVRLIKDKKSNKTVIVPKETKTNSPSKGLNWDGLI